MVQAIAKFEQLMATQSYRGAARPQETFGLGNVHTHPFLSELRRHQLVSTTHVSLYYYLAVAPLGPSYVTPLSINRKDTAVKAEQSGRKGEGSYQ